MTRWLLVVLNLVAMPSALYAEDHRFTPKVYHNTFSYEHAPALRIKPGDRVITQTIDASGVDRDGKTVGAGPNPETGPFFVEGAEPGDTLIVTFERIETNRNSGWSNSVLAPYAVDPAFLRGGAAPPQRVTWTIDKAAGVARLISPDVVPSPIEIPLRPMLGCAGTAPPRKESIATSTPGSFGGNMDYAGLVAGVRLMLPVSEPGALLFIGDGHAAQGHGEVVGTGIETSMDVTFTVNLVKNKRIGWPRLENADYIVVLGSARPLLQAFQHATTELQSLLMSDYGYNERGAATLLGQSAEYEIANVVDPNFTVAAKIKKSLLRPAR